ncbi:adenylate/guanylate cyclase domain-containing protein [Ruegeria sediminis]|uniref:Adenylate/guanylate cyclase domain-containing protein n=1 Tax=Ruegeria sediminis TaxID=2583820 RepID=A0ABY2X5F2_9RHOB|nr:adenylate/guanylate cyclase domain-containing protein [Ruegeria sediminis]TMV10313.1 adenylate/guanylate cyclase domain-containing protein [Ruegeria sediminis]
MFPSSRKWHRKWVFFAAGLILVLIGCFVRVLDPYPVQATRLIYFDYLQRLSPRPFDPDLPVRVVDIDEVSLSEYGQWPWPRTILARMVDRLGEYGAAAIAFDMLFAEPDRYSPSRLANDPLFAAVLRDDSDLGNLDNDVRFGTTIAGWPVVLGVAARLGGDQDEVTPRAGIIEIGENPGSGLVKVPNWTPLAPPLGVMAAGIGGVNVSPLGGLGVVRTVPLLWASPEGILPSLSIEALRVAMGEPNIFAEGALDEAGIMLSLGIGGFQIPTTEHGEIWVRYRPDDPRLYLSAADVLAEEFDPALRDQIEGRIVLVGTSAAGLLDIRETSLGESVPGVSIHAQIIEQIVIGEVLQRSDVTAALELICFVLLGLIVTGVMSGAGAVPSFVAGGVAAASVVGISWAAFQYNSVLFDVTFPLVGGMVNFGVLAGYLFVSTEREKRAIRRTFAHYVAPEILDEMETSGHALELGGETQDITVMFSDIRGFTPLTETMSATDLVKLLNELFSSVGDQILAEKGTIDKFIGDAVMAFWNAPMPLQDHALRAARAALRMRAAVAGFNDAPKMRGRAPIVLATGCASGRACVGNIGSSKRFNYTVVGDVVNVAARIEQICRHVEYDILVSEAVFDAGKDTLAMLEAGVVPLKGKSRAESIYLVVGDEDIARSAGFAELSESHDRLISMLRDGKPPPDIEAMAGLCAELARAIEPGLVRFYSILPERSADFRPGSEAEQIAFRHFQFSRSAGA